VKAWFISDIHLKSLNERNGNILLRFLFSFAQGERQATHLFLLGDIFDFWVGNHDFYTNKFRPFVDALMALKKQGIQIYYAEGNHDVHVKKFWQDQGIESFVEDQYYQLGPWLTRVSHGDLINPEDHTYLRYRTFIRKKYMEAVAQLIPARQLFAIGDWASQISRKKSVVRRRENGEHLRSLIRTYAIKCHQERPYDFLISGHMHVQDEWVTKAEDGKKFTSLNLGSWFEIPTALWIDEGSYGWEPLIEES
jgi:UDP-2,3-diacylglucosamine hydrolase